MFIDTHCHLNDDVLYVKLEETILEARRQGVSKMICIGYDKLSSIRALEIAKNNPGIYATIGFHPTNALDVTEEDFLWLEQNLSHEKVVGIGEIGLDYYWDATYKEKQKEVFLRQIALAKKYHLPISIHMRDALEDTLNILREQQSDDLQGVMHCYSGSVESAKEFIKLNMYISLAGPVTFKNARVPKEVAKEVLFERLLIETDSPYLAPHPFRGKENSPALLPYVAKEIASLRNISVEEVAMQTMKNALNLYSKIIKKSG